MNLYSNAVKYTKNNGTIKIIIDIVKKKAKGDNTKYQGREQNVYEEFKKDRGKDVTKNEQKF